MAEQTLVIIKPDGIQRHLAGEIIGRLEKKGLKLVAAKFIQLSEEQARQVYAVHQGKPFLERLVRHMASSPSLVTVWEAQGAIDTARKILGATSGYEAEPGTIRGDFSCSERYNLAHGADSPESAEKEIKLFFKSDELVNYELTDAHWLYGKND